MDKPIQPTDKYGNTHPRKCPCFSCDEYNYALIFWEKEQHEKENNQ